MTAGLPTESLNDVTARLKSTLSPSFPALLASGGISLLVTTYQAGQLITLRHDGQGLNTHFCHFSRPMGLAADRGRVALGCDRLIHEFYNMPSVIPRLEGPYPIQPDACYLPRQTHVTGNIDIHEMSWAGDVLWFVNTRFSCLCTLEAGYSFAPRWRPPFISDLAAEDRCHLNGLSVVNGQPKYVTALGATNEPQGWRENKAHGGILMDVETNEIICQGLSMPHSPRWYRNQLWVLESGQGSLAKVDLATGKLTTVARLPGFTRGIAFGGPLAFIGLSQIRETSLSSGLPLTEQISERICGIWVVNIETGQTVAHLKFQGDVREIFAVSILAQTRYPEILRPDHDLVSTTYALSEQSLQQVAKHLTS